MQSFQILQQALLEAVRALGICRDVLHLLQRPAPPAGVDGLPQRGRPEEVGVGQQFDVPQAQPLAGQGLHEPLDRLPAHRVHAHERPQRVEVGVHGKGPAEEDLLDRRAHLLAKAPPHAHPASAAGKGLGDVRHAHPVDRKQFGEEPRFLQDVQGHLGRASHQVEDPCGFLFAQRNEGDVIDRELLGCPLPFEAVQEDAGPRPAHAGQRSLDPTLADGGQQARFPSVVPQAIALITQVQTRPFHHFAHGIAPHGGCSCRNARA